MARNLKSDIRSALRRVWLYSDLRKNAVTAARVGRGLYKCRACEEIVGAKEFDVDHVVKATPSSGIEKPEDWGLFIKALLYCGEEGVVVLCKPCHAKKTECEKYEVKQARITKKKVKKRALKKSKRVRPSRTSRVYARRTRGTV